MEGNYYAVLDVEPSATPQQIRQAYRSRALQTHPDRNLWRREAAEDEFKRVSEAYEVLSDPTRRAEYDGCGRFDRGSAFTFRTPAEVFCEFFGEDEQEAPAGVSSVEPELVFNLPLFESYFVIDTRSAELYETGRITTSMSFPWDGDRDLAAFLMRVDAEYGMPERRSPIVVVGDELSAAFTAETAARLFAATRQALTGHEGINRFLSRAKAVWVVRGGVAAFQQRFPSLCGLVAAGNMEPTPHWVAPNLFLGSRAVPHTAASLMRFGVTHMIVSSECKEIIPGVSYLRCAVKDEDDQDMAACWEDCLQFILAAHSVGGVVLVSLHGRSRSASVVMAWLVRVCNLTTEAAARILKEVCPHIDWRLSFPDQLTQGWIQNPKRLKVS